jgi:hypothetical protein
MAQRLTRGHTGLALRPVRRWNVRTPVREHPLRVLSISGAILDVRIPGQVDMGRLEQCGTLGVERLPRCRHADRKVRPRHGALGLYRRSLCLVSGGLITLADRIRKTRREPGFCISKCSGSTGIKARSAECMGCLSRIFAPSDLAGDLPISPQPASWQTLGLAVNTANHGRSQR